MKIFTFGTLMQGFGNHRVMQDAQGKFLGKGYILNKDIHFSNPGSYPVVVDGKGIVFGEVWEISENKIKMPYGDSLYPVQILDRLEGYNPNRPVEHNLYVRKKIVVYMNGMRYWASYYHWNRPLLKNLHIKSGDWAAEYLKYKGQNDKQ